ncbi:FliM/FliN family flagellar motor switch protein [Chelativorans sp. YIM 93263]|uniref:FliM/FliN family flagellar motor switch protein n=1 Tax=Chelativorans sp. YIM 93263 TaxID=2906648 RepID=UPI002379A0D7|nr:FliM/FliN family flagellar motor switch protein [Chelativorans sp. YIM 93263]
MTIEAEDQEQRGLVIERLTGATGDPRKVVEAARSVAFRALPLLSDAFSEASSAPLLIDVADVDIARLAEVRPESDSYEVLVVVPAGISRDALSMRLDPSAISLLVHALFGGDPDIPTPPLDRQPSYIERDVAAVVFEHFAKALNGSGARALGLRLPVTGVLSGPREFKRMVVRDGPGVRIMFSLTMGENTGYLTAWMPQRVLLETRASTDPADDGPGAAEWQHRFNNEVLRSTVTLTATMPLRKMPLAALADLKEGQVLELNENARSNARITVRNNTIFTGEFGRLGENYTVRIKAPSDARQEVIDGLLGE